MKILEELLELRAQKDKVSEQLKSINKQIMEVELKVDEYLEENDMTSIEFGGYRFKGETEVYAKIVDKDALFSYLKEKGDFENLITLSAATAKKYWNEQKQLHTTDEPFEISGMEPTSMRKKLSIRRVK